MHEGEDGGKIAAYYGFWPTIVGILFGAGVIWFLFAFADGFA